MSYTKKLIEVALPLEDINAASAREKSIRHGHPSTLHLWWARRPLAAARAVLFSQLVDDPSGYVDELRNNSKLVKKSESELKKRLKDWRDKKELFDQVQAGGGQGTNPGDEPTLDAILVELERERLFNMIRELVLWENTTNERVLETARKEIRISWRRTCRREGKPEDTPMPPFLDPFAGGGAIPLEAQRLGLEAHASDLNPVAVLINKAMIEIPPKFAHMPPVHPKACEELGTTGWKGAGGLAEDVKRYGEWMREEAMKRIGHLYPPYKLTQELIDSRPNLQEQGYKDGDELTVIAWLWARAVPSPNPALLGKYVPLVSTYWLSKKPKSEAFLLPHIEGDEFRFEVCAGLPSNLELIQSGTKAKGKGGNFECLISNVPISNNYIREISNSGRMKKLPLAVVCLGNRKREFLPFNDSQIIDQIESDFLNEIEISKISGYLNPPLYGFTSLGSFFNDRQRISLETFSNLVSKVIQQVENDGGNREYATAIAIYLTLSIGRLENRLSTFSIWNNIGLKIEQTFSEQGIGMTWDYAEANPFSGASGSWSGSLSWIPKCINNFPTESIGIVHCQDAELIHQEIKKSVIISTDPPYYSSITYADFADYFYGLFRHSLKNYLPEIFRTISTPKQEEAVAAWHRFDGSKEKAGGHFRKKLGAIIKNIQSSSYSDFPISIYYAFKEKEFENGLEASFTAWESILGVIIESGLSVVATWPIRTERVTGRKARKNVLATSVIIVCKKRSTDAKLSTRKEFVQELNTELKENLSILMNGSISPVDLPQSSIGPGFAIFSQFSKVLEADGTAMTVTKSLQLINRAVDEFLSEQEAGMDSWTRFAVTWFLENQFNYGLFGDAEILSKARNVSVEGVREAGIIESGGGKVRLLRRDELDPNWDPATDTRLTVWEVTHYLIRELLDGGGEIAAAKLLKKVGGLAEDAKGLAYRLYTICEQNKWADLGRDYNMLVSLWPELVKQSQEIESEQSTQSELEI